ncbi:MAG: Uroporphyrinogen-III C-methyltransferase [Rhodospirillaceae bacterium]|nr:uroporphyrinogen-III C-methyltransferase [Alphaproteobacteria bacterium]CAI8429962.1 MAG: Uroporphyrinogen-III C-methyltransferase [Rhodospirillaceae bacterium]
MIRDYTFPPLEPGWVWLVGAGPGDPGLISLLGAEALRQADAVVYDALVDERLLSLAPANAEIVFAGKRGGRPSPKQTDITQRLIEIARSPGPNGDAGKRVVRLKGGDPFVFGRGGEECLTLREAGVPFRIVPGISAGVGGLAYAGIPVTHRDVNAAVSFVTGHSMTGDMPDERLDWEALAKGSPVLVIFMGIRHVEQITRRLIAAGRPAEQPVAVVCKATYEDQAVLMTTLGACAADVAAAGLRPPSLIVVGDVVPLADHLHWNRPEHQYGNQPTSSPSNGSGKG